MVPAVPAVKMHSRNGWSRGVPTGRNARIKRVFAQSEAGLSKLNVTRRKRSSHEQEQLEQPSEGVNPRGVDRGIRFRATRHYSDAVRAAGGSHAPIVIAHDSDFQVCNCVVSGSGTTANPYVIGPWTINSTLPGQTAVSVDGNASDQFFHALQPDHRRKRFQFQYGHRAESHQPFGTKNDFGRGDRRPNLHSRRWNRNCRAEFEPRHSGW